MFVERIFLKNGKTLIIGQKKEAHQYDLIISNQVSKTKFLALLKVYKCKCVLSIIQVSV